MSKLFVPINKAELTWFQNLPFSIQYDDVYHSMANGLEQSRHVFIEGNNLIQRWQACERFTIAETGFGTGLNFLLTWHLWEQHAPQQSHLHFISCEKHPFSVDDLKRALSCWPQLAPQALQLLENYPVLTPGYHHLSFAEGRVRLTLMLGDALECYEQLLICGDASLETRLRTSWVDAWYLDGFAPTKNKSMWSDALMNVIALLSHQGTTAATYTVAREVKDSLTQHGFIVEKSKGYGPKRHMLRASYNPHEKTSLKRRHTPWHVSDPEHYQDKSAVIIGAGLAGCYLAYALAQRGWNITLFDELNEVGAGASANQQAVLFPNLSAYNSPLTQLMLLSFLYARRAYESFLKHSDLGALHGCFMLANNLKEQQAQATLKDWLTHYPELGCLVDADHASELVGFSLTDPGLYIPLSGWLNSPALCRFLIDHPRISLVTGVAIEHLSFTDKWQVNDQETEVLILANGFKLTSFPETSFLPIKPIRGQMSAIAATAESVSLNIPLCAEGHVLPAHKGIHYFGATYELNGVSLHTSAEDDLLNLAKLHRLAPETSWDTHVVTQWAGVRASTTDYLPIVGKIPRQLAFNEIYRGLESNSKRWINQAGPYHRGLFAFAGFGSRGLTTIPLCAEWLAATINNEMGYLPRNLQQAISPARFLRKKIVRGQNF